MLIYIPLIRNEQVHPVGSASHILGKRRGDDILPVFLDQALGVGVYGGEIVPIQLICAKHPFREPLHLELLFRGFKTPADRGFCLNRDSIAVFQAGFRDDLELGFIGILCGGSVGNLQLRLAFAGHAGELDAHDRKRIGGTGEGELVHRRVGDEHIDQADSSDHAKGDEPALEAAPALPIALQILDVLVGAGLRYAPFVFLLRGLFFFDEHFVPTVGADGLFLVCG